MMSSTGVRIRLDGPVVQLRTSHKTVGFSASYVRGYFYKKTDVEGNVHSHVMSRIPLVWAEVPHGAEIEFHPELPEPLWDNIQRFMRQAGGLYGQGDLRDRDGGVGYHAPMSVKNRGRKVAFANNIQPRLNSGQSTARAAFTQWNRGFGNDKVKDYNQQLWRYKIGRRSTPPDYRAMGIRRDQAEANEEVIDTIAARR